MASNDESGDEETMMSPAPNNEAMENAVRDNPDNPTPWLVYADWLQQKGSVLGELVVLQHTKGVAETQAFIAQRKADIFEDCEEPFDGGFIDQLEWHMGFLKGARLNTEYDAKMKLDELTDRFLRLPATRFLRKLTFGAPGFEGDDDFTEIVSTLLKSRRTRTIEELFLGDFEYPDQNEMSWVGAGDLSGLWKGLPKLTRLRVRGGLNGTFGKIDAPNLKSFTRETGGMPQEELDSFIAAKWPKLEHLELWLGSGNYGAEATPDTLRPILQANGLPKLKSLGLKNSEIADELVEPLAKSAVLKQLDAFDFSMGTLTDLGATILLGHAEAFAHLKSFDLSANCIEDAAMISALRAKFPRATIGAQREGYDGEHYAAVGE